MKLFFLCFVLFGDVFFKGNMEFFKKILDYLIFLYCILDKSSREDGNLYYRV